MDRINDAEADPERVAFHRADQVAGADAGQDDDLDPLDRRNREHVAYYQDANGNWVPCPLKRNDDVLVAGCIPVRVIGPQRDRGFFFGYYAPWFGDSLFSCSFDYISHRAPADPNEPVISPDADEKYMPLLPAGGSMMMMAAPAEGSETDPRKAARAERREARADRRDQRATLRELIAQQPPDMQRKLRDALRDKGLLGKDGDGT